VVAVSKVGGEDRMRRPAGAAIDAVDRERRNPIQTLAELT